MAAEIAKIDQNEDSESFFFDNIRSDNSELRLAAIGMARKIARKLGPQETMRSIFPLIQELTKEADEDIRFAILNELKDFIELMGGDTQASLLLDTLQTFLSSDDTTIRNYAYEVVLDIVKNLSPEKITDSFVPFVDELLNNEWFTARMSGMLLWSTAYTSSNEEKQEDLLKKLISLADDKIMSVRRIFAMMLADIFDLLGAQCFYNRIFDTAIHLFNDPLDSVKMSNIISFTILMPKMKDKVDESTKVFNLLRELSGDKSWRVRYAVVIEYPHLLHAANSDDILQKLLIDLNNLLDDREPEVRLAAAKILSKMFSKEHPEHVENFFTESMWERIENLITNSDSDMGSTMVEQIGKISLILSDHQYKENFIPLLERVLKNTNPEVKLKGLSILSCVRKEYNVLENNLVEGLKDMSSSSTWRVRLSLVEHISIIAQSMDFDKTEVGWTSWCCEMLQDEANAVRESTVDTVIELMKKLGNDWIIKFIEDRLIFYSNCESYLLKISTIYLLENVCQQCSSDKLKSLIIENLINYTTDLVANVRFNAVRALELLKDSVSKSEYLSKTLTSLEDLISNDKDQDVVYFSNRALQSYKN